MTKPWIVAGSLALIAALIGAFATGLIRFGLGETTCRIDGEIASSDRASVERSALAFATRLLGSDPGSAYAFFAPETKREISRAMLVSGAEPVLRQFGPFTGIHVSHSYLVRARAGGPITRAICGSVKGIEWVSVAVKPGISQAHVLIAAATRNNDWALTAWLQPQGGGWQVRDFRLNVSATAGRSAENLLELARRERASGNDFNAALLYADVAATSYRGANFQTGIQQSLHEDEATFRPPPELRGKPPFKWNLRGSQFAVSDVTVIGVGRNLGLVFLLPLSAWRGAPDADEENRAFLAGFMATHPAFSRVFAFLVARALKPDNSGGFGTVYEVGKGFKS